MRTRITHYLMAFCMSGSLWSQCNLNPVWVQASDGLNCPNSGGGFSIAQLGGTPPYTFSLPPSTYLAGGTYAWWNFVMTGQIQVTDAIGCQGVVNMYMWVVYAPDVANISTLPSCNGQATGSVTFQVASEPVFTNVLQLVNGAGQVLQNLSTLSGAGSISNLAAGNYYFHSATSFNGCNETFDYPFTIAGNASNCSDVNVNLRAALQGPLPSGTVMTDGLRAINLIPLNEPYSALGYTYVGSSPGASTSTSLLAITGNDAIVDWVVVELRNAATPSQVVASKAALIQRDGDVVAPNGGGVAFPVPAGNYHIALRHRNHLGVMTGVPQALSASPQTIDLRSGATACYGTTPRAQVGSVYCLWSGDSNGNGSVKYTGTGNDRDLVLTAVGSTAPNNTLFYQYSRLDTNLDGQVKYTGSGNDRDIILTNVGSTTPNNMRTQQLP